MCPSSLSHCQCLYGSADHWQFCPFIRWLLVSQPTAGLSEYARHAVNKLPPLPMRKEPLLLCLSSFVLLMSAVEDIWDILGKVGEKRSMLQQSPFFSLPVYWMRLASPRGLLQPHTDISKQRFFTQTRSLILTTWLADQWLAEVSLERAPESWHFLPFCFFFLFCYSSAFTVWLWRLQLSIWGFTLVFSQITH